MNEPSVFDEPDMTLPKSVIHYYSRMTTYYTHG